MFSVSLPNTGQPNNCSGSLAHASGEAHTNMGQFCPSHPREPETVMLAGCVMDIQIVSFVELGEI